MLQTLKLLGVTALVIFPLITHAQEASVVIEMNENGYSPNEVTIEPGTLVVFKNTGTADMWPASDNHPSHTLYDGTTLNEHCAPESEVTFDACRAIQPQEEWLFNFERAGKYNFHDHLWPHLKGNIQVGQPQEKAGFFERLIQFSSNFFAMVRNTFFPFFSTHHNAPQLKTLGNNLDSNPYVKITLEQDPTQAIKALKEASSLSSDTFAECHEILHAIGKTAYEKYSGFEAASVFQSDFCNSGYIHGVFEAHFTSSGEPLAGLENACSYLGESPREFDLWQCRHGIGHGLMYYTGGELDDSISLCREIFNDGKPVTDCQNGVYMEVFNQEILAKEPDFINPEEPLQTCAQRTENQSDCYHYIPTYLSQLQGMDYLEIFSVCDEVPAVYKDSCKLGVGTEAMKRNMSEPNEVFNMCGQVKSLREQTLCVTGATSMYINQTGSLSETETMCLKSPLLYSTICREVVKMRAKDFN